MKIWAVEKEGKPVEVFVNEEDARSFVAEFVEFDYKVAPYAVARRTCLVEDCNNERVRKGYCGKHYLRIERHGDPLVAAPRGRKPKRNIEPCLIHGCEKKYQSMGLCQTHYYLLNRKGEEYSQEGYNRVYENSPRKKMFKVKPYYG